jgi:hypothetical protein
MLVPNKLRKNPLKFVKIFLKCLKKILKNLKTGLERWVKKQYLKIKYVNLKKKWSLKSKL